MQPGEPFAARKHTIKELVVDCLKQGTDGWGHVHLYIQWTMWGFSSDTEIPNALYI